MLFSLYDMYNLLTPRLEDHHDILLLWSKYSVQLLVALAVHPCEIYDIFPPFRSLDLVLSRLIG